MCDRQLAAALAALRWIADFSDDELANAKMLHYDMRNIARSGIRAMHYFGADVGDLKERPWMNTGLIMLPNPFAKTNSEESTS